MIPCDPLDPRAPIGLPSRPMKMLRQVVVFDAADLEAESTFWAGVFDAAVFRDDHFHCVIDAAGNWYVGVQLAPDHVPPDWPSGTPQQVHVDLHVEHAQTAHDAVTRLGATVLAAGDLSADAGHQVYADPAGHPFCIGWGHPTRAEVAAFASQSKAGS